MKPPALEVGWEFIQSQPLINKGVKLASGATATATGWTIDNAAKTIKPDDTVQMKAWKMRLRLKGKAAVNIKTSFNIDKLFYNEIVFDMDEFVSYVFGDIIIVHTDQSASGTNPLAAYSSPNICWAAGYNYNAITLSLETLFKYPNCYKMIINSLTDWSQWTSIIT